jgi:preprotein translocase subunit SecD
MSVNYGRLLRDWRVWLLVVVMIVSLVGLVPLGGGSDGATALSFGLELEGGTLVQLSPVGTTVDSTGFDPTESDNVSDEIEARVDVPVRVHVGQGLQGAPAQGQQGDGGTIEFRGDISQENATSAVEDAGYNVEGVSDGVVQDTLEDLRGSIELRLNERLGEGAGAEVSIQSNIFTGEDFIVVEVPGEREEDGRVIEIIRTQGEFEIRAVTDPQTDNQTLITRGDGVLRDSVSPPLEDQSGEDRFRVSFELDDEASQSFRQTMIEVGATDPATRPDHPPVMYFNGEEVFRGELNPSLASSIREGTWGGGGLSVTGLDEDQAQLVSVSLRSGALPTPIEIASSTTISPRQGERFKTFSLVIAFLAVLGVGTAIYSRYRDLRIAVPTVLVGLAEVVALLGFSAVFDFNVDLAYVAGLIAVIGTGVDDLIIIADEVQERGSVTSAEVYRKRLKRAFIIIGMAATTTIGAMLPLAYLGLGRISGFAVVTIVGVIIGVAVTRPAYGSVLRELITEKD